MQVRTAQTKVSTQRWQFFARLGTALWVIVDNIMSAMGKNLPGRRRSLDPAIRSMATETGQQSNAKALLENARTRKESACSSSTTTSSSNWKRASAPLA